MGKNSVLHMIGEPFSKDFRDEYFREMREDLKAIIQNVVEIKLDMKDIRLEMKDLIHKDTFFDYKQAIDNQAGKLEQRLQSMEGHMLTQEKLNKAMEKYLEKPAVQTILAEKIEDKKRQARRNLFEDWSHLQKVMAILGSLLIASGFGFYIAKENQPSLPKYVERHK